MKEIACVVLPTYNEAENVKIVIPRILEQENKIATHELHVVVVDDNSPDGTGGIVQMFMQTFPNIHLLTGEKKGLGEAYKRGMAYALNELHADLIFEMDADLQHDPELIPLFVSLANHGFSLTIGSRFICGGATPNFAARRRWMSLVGTWLVCKFGGLPSITDCTSGFRCIKADVFAKCDLTGVDTRGYSFQSSLLCELVRNGARVIEVPIQFQGRAKGESKLRMLDQVEFLANLFRLWRKRLAVSSGRTQPATAGAPAPVQAFVVSAETEAPNRHRAA